MVSEKGLNEMNEVVGGHFPENAIPIIVHRIRQTFKGFDIITKVAKIDKAGM